MSTQALDRIELADYAGSIVLYDWMSGDVKDGRNLVRIDPNGRILWKATPPTTQDCFTGMQWDGQTLTANTWSCYRVSIDIQSGSVTVLEFTK